MHEVELVSHDPKWQEQFLAIATELTKIPVFRNMPINHIGSTAIAGIEAKNVIDVQLGVTDLLESDQYHMELIERGYAHKPHLTDHIPTGCEDDTALWTKEFWTTEDRVPKVNLHIRQIGNPNWRFAILFRDYLRNNLRMAQSYEAAKRALSKTVDASQYGAVKDPIVDIIMVAAEEWATRTNWEPKADNADGRTTQ